MVAYMEALSLGHLGLANQENGLDGQFLLQCTQAKLQSIGIRSLQYKKILTYMPR